MQAIGLSGFAGSGKTTVAHYIEEQYGFRRKHIAEPLRAMLVPLMRAAGVAEAAIPRYLEGDLKESMIPELGRTSRELQITLGTEWGRKHVGDDLWAKLWSRNNAPGERLMNDSVRFPNEEASIAQLGGITILIRREGCGPAKFSWGAVGRWLFDKLGVMWGVHASERTDRLHPSYVLDNNGSIADLHFQVDCIMSRSGLNQKTV